MNKLILIKHKQPCANKKLPLSYLLTALITKNKVHAIPQTILLSFIIILTLLISGNVIAQDKVFTKNTTNKESISAADSSKRGGDFSLIGTTSSGEKGWVSLSDFKGKVVAIYFGYTKCPDVCPTNLSFLSSAIAQLTPKEKKNFQSIFISVDPGRDTPEVLTEYVRYFDNKMIGLSAAPDDLDPVVVQYGAFYEKVPFSNSALMYGIDHTSETYIVGKDGQLFAILDHATASKEILKTIRKAMK